MSADADKRAAAEAALAYVEDGMTLGLGTGSTAAHFVDLLGARVRAGLRVRGAATSEDTRRRAEQAGVPVIAPDETTGIDLAVDGADEIDERLDLIKGGGGALLREKIIAGAARRFLVIADASKKVGALGRFPLPVEIDGFAYGLTVRRIRGVIGELGLSGAPRLRFRPDGNPFLSDGGHLILDCPLGRIERPGALDAALRAIPGVVETGLFVGMASLAIVAGGGRVETLARA